MVYTHHVSSSYLPSRSPTGWTSHLLSTEANSAELALSGALNDRESLVGRLTCAETYENTPISLGIFS